MSFLENVLISGYGGTVCLESAHDFFRAIPNRRTATDAMRSLLFLESVVRQRLERPAAETASAAVPRRILSNVSLFDPPDPPPLDGFSFVEFGVDADTALRLAAVFQKLGFARFGRHRTKDVTLYRQGDIHLLLNADLGSDARRRFEERGASVCCLGLLADNPAQAANRGTALLSARHEGRRGPQELPLPTIVAPGGTLLQFVPPPFDTVEADFISEPPPVPVTDCGLKTVDHVAMRLGVEQLDTWVLFASAVLGLTPAAGVQIAEPFGLIRSRGVSNDSRLVRMVLNAAVSRVGVRGGGGVPPTSPSGDVGTSRSPARTSSKPSGAYARTAWRLCRCRGTTTTTSSPGSRSLHLSSSGCAGSTSPTTMLAAATTFTPTPMPSRAGFISRSFSGSTTTAMARPMRPPAPRRSNKPDMCKSGSTRSCDFTGVSHDV